MILKKQEKIDLAPAQALQPKIRTIRYDNMKSAMAEEGILGQILREPAMLEQAKELTGSDFSVPLLGKVYDELRSRYSQGLEVSLSVLGDYTPAEVSHIAAISQRQQGPVNEDAFRDCCPSIAAQQCLQMMTC